MAVTPGLNHSLFASVDDAAGTSERLLLGVISIEDAFIINQIREDAEVVSLPTIIEIVKAVAGTVSNKITDGAKSASTTITALPFDLEDKIKGWIMAALGPALDIISSIPDKVIATVRTVGSAVEGSINSLQDRILGPVFAVIASVLTQISLIDDKVKDIVNLAVAPVVAASSTLLDKVEGFATAIRDTIPGLGDVLSLGLESGAGIIADGVGDAAKQVLNAFFGDIAEDVVNRIDPLITMFEEELSVAPELRALTAPGALPLVAVGGLIAGFAMPMILANVGSTALSPFSEKLRQRMNDLVRPSLIAATDAMQAQQRGFMEPSVTGTILDRLGFPEDQQEALFKLVKLRPGTLDIIDYWRRELITDGEADTRFQDLGWDAIDRNLIKSAAFPPPGVQDLIRMAVREVFSPEIAEQFGQFEGQPPAYTSWAKKIGLSEEWARNYWAAHWVLPSVQQGFEMLHRQVITGDDLERLFVALDVMPFWRQPLKDISFRPFTRVDVRRMFALGVLNRAGVLRSYLDLGFSPEKAENMTEFTVRWVESTTKVEKEKERDLTKGDVIGLFNDGLLNEAQAISRLESMGFDRNESQLLISREVMQELRLDRKADIRLIVDQAKIKVLTFSEAQDQLNGLDLTQDELRKAMVDVQRATTERIRLPSKADLDGWKELNLLSLPQYEIELDNLGFPAKYVALYVEAIQLEEAEDLLAAEVREAARTEPRPITKGQLDRLLRAEIIDTEEYIAGLTALGFTDEAVGNFVAEISLQIEEIRLEDEARIARGEGAAEKEALLSRVVLGKLLIKELIPLTAYQEGLRKLGFNPASIELLTQLIVDKIATSAEEEEA
ncbi:hypothetical protein LCGC14_1501530 [marine sediment metagenome]|uniref:Uncharacterized protein n=1 Tax=marine sediment metagenome TaxID=412755 RepID=A0A0F9J3Z1_9ZZZZ